MNNDKRVKDSAFQLEFCCAPSSFDFILEQIKQGQPVIVFLLHHSYDSEIKHAVIVHSISKDKTKIGISDPLKHKPIDKSTGTFMEEWDKLLRYTIYVKVNEFKDLTMYFGADKE